MFCTQHSPRRRNLTLFYVFPHFSSTCHTRTPQTQRTHPPVSESHTTSTCCSCRALLLLTSLLSFSPRTASTVPVFTSDCLNEPCSEEQSRSLNEGKSTADDRSTAPAGHGI